MHRRNIEKNRVKNEKLKSSRESRENRIVKGKDNETEEGKEKGKEKVKGKEKETRKEKENAKDSIQASPPAESPMVATNVALMWQFLRMYSFPTEEGSAPSPPAADKDKETVTSAKDGKTDSKDGKKGKGKKGYKKGSKGNGPVGVDLCSMTTPSSVLEALTTSILK